VTADHCAEAERFRRIDSAFRSGDLEALRAAVDDPAAVPNGRTHDAIGSCLVYAIYHSPIDFVRTLLEIGADPNAPADDGFPPLIAALSGSRAAPGATPRNDVDEILRLLLSFGADANQRGINDYTPLHMHRAPRGGRGRRRRCRRTPHLRARRRRRLLLGRQQQRPARRRHDDEQQHPRVRERPRERRGGDRGGQSSQLRGHGRGWCRVLGSELLRPARQRHHDRKPHAGTGRGPHEWRRRRERGQEPRVRAHVGRRRAVLG
jgi:hypothetical protein